MGLEFGAFTFGLALALLLCVEYSESTPTTPEDDGSGTANAGASSFIVGGTAAERHEFPFIISMQVNGRHYCGGSLLNKYWVVTAGHCVQFPISNLTIVAGEHDLEEYSGTEQVRKVGTIVIHEDYDPAVLSHDIALMRVTNPFDLDGFTVTTIELANPSKPPPVEAVVAGWGAVAVGEYPAILQKVTIPHVPDAQCREEYAAIPGMPEVLPSMVCYGEEGKGAYYGDSGGPLLGHSRVSSGSGSSNGHSARESEGDNDNENRLLYALVSWGSEGPAQPGQPGVYTRISSFYSWIHAAIDRDDCN